MPASDSRSDSIQPLGDSQSGLNQAALHDFKAMREGLGVSQRDLAERTQIPQATLSRIEGGVREASLDEVVRITTALGADVTEQPVYREAVRQHQAKPGVRRAFVCQKCRTRTYLSNEPAAFVPECPAHGPMVRQANRPYMGQSTEPPAEWGWPQAVDGG